MAATKKLFLAFVLLTVSTLSWANCTFNTSQYLFQLQEPSSINEIHVEVPKSASFVKNFLRILTSGTRNIPPTLKKDFEARIIVDYEFGRCIFSASVRQTGDWKDHISLVEGNPLRSLNVKLREGNIMNAIRFKLLIPATRNDLNEVLGSLVARELGFISPETFQVRVDVNGSKSVMLFQEDAQKELLERNLRREGPIFEADESLIWTDERQTVYRDDVTLARLINKKWFLAGQSSQYITLSAFPKLQNAYLAYTNYKNKALMLFPDNSAFEDFHFLMLAMKGWHALRPHNRRFYYNSFKDSFEPIYYDGMLTLTIPIDLSMKANRLTIEELSFAFKSDYVFPFTSILGTPEFKSKLLPKFQNRVIRFNNVKQNFFEESLSQVHANVVSLQTKISELEVPVPPHPGNLSEHELYTSRVLKRNLNQKHVSSIKVNNQNFLLTYQDKTTAIVSPEALASMLSKNVLDGMRHVLLPENSMQLDFQEERANLKEIKLLEGNILSSLSTSVIIKEKERVIVITQSNPKDWVLFRDADISEWNITFQGLPINKEDPSLQRFNIHGMTGCLNFYNSKFNHTSLHITGGQCEDSLNIVNSWGNISVLEVKDAYADAIDLDFSQLTLVDIEVQTAGNDCLDVSSGIYKINYASLADCQDKALSVGEKSQFEVNDISIHSAFIGMSVKDFSSLVVTNAKVRNVTICAEAVQKKQEFGGGVANLKHIECTGQYSEDKNSSLFRSEN